MSDSYQPDDLDPAEAVPTDNSAGDAVAIDDADETIDNDAEPAGGPGPASG